MCKNQSFEFEIYQTIRSEIKHEYDLISNRLGWQLTSQTFLFTALALGIKTAGDKFSSKDAIFDKIVFLQNQSIFYPILPWLGLIISFFILFGIWAAILRIAIWAKREKSEFNHLVKTPYHNALKAGRPLINILGLLPATFVPAAFFITWLFIIIDPVIIKIIQVTDISKELILLMSASVMLIGLSIFVSQIFIELCKDKPEQCFPSLGKCNLYQIGLIVIFLVIIISLYYCSEIIKTILLYYVIAFLAMAFIGLIVGWLAYKGVDQPISTSSGM